MGETRDKIVDVIEEKLKDAASDIAYQIGTELTWMLYPRSDHIESIETLKVDNERLRKENAEYGVGNRYRDDLIRQLRDEISGLKDEVQREKQRR